MDATLEGTVDRLGSARVLVVDSHPFVGWALARRLAEHAALPTIVTDSDAAVRALTEGAFDAAVLDGSLADVASGHLLSRLRTAAPNLAAVVMTRPQADGAGAARDLAAGWGATCYLAANAGTEDLLDAICETLAKARAAARHRRGPRSSVCRPATPGVTLSPREQQVLELLRDGHSLPAVAATLRISMSTTKTYVARLYDKLDSANRTEALMRALRLGLLQAESQLTAG